MVAFSTTGLFLAIVNPVEGPVEDFDKTRLKIMTVVM
jgi:hypothetical protein